ncbi:MAG: rhodanese-like domain-containing protein, partial [Gaiellaceae bacterium]
AALLLLLHAAPAAAAAADTAAVVRLDVAQALEAQRAGSAVLVDVRPLPQRALGHIRGDLHRPLTGPDAPADVPAGKRAVFYCSCPAEELALLAARQASNSGHKEVAVLVGGYDAWRASGAPIAVDETWEESFRVDETPAGWGKTPIDSARCRYARDESVAYRGVASGRIGCASDTVMRGLAGLVQRVDAGLAAGRNITVTAMVRSDSVAQAAFLWLGAEDATGRLIAMTRADHEPIRGTGDWHAAAVTGRIPPGATKLLYGISLAGTGRVWIDEVRVVAEPEADQRGVRLVVENAGFEQ